MESLEILEEAVFRAIMNPKSEPGVYTHELLIKQGGVLLLNDWRGANMACPRRISPRYLRVRSEFRTSKDLSFLGTMIVARQDLGDIESIRALLPVLLGGDGSVAPALQKEIQERCRSDVILPCLGEAVLMSDI